jgi:hypothetical protein
LAIPFVQPVEIIMSLRKIIVAAILATSSFAAAAADFKPDLSKLDSIPMHNLPAGAVQKSIRLAQSKTSPLQFAVGVAMPLQIGDGAWQQLDANTWNWRTRIFSANAETLNLHFRKLQLPTGASLWIYDAAGRRVEGPYTAANLGSDGQLWTPVVPGTTAVVEIRSPALVKDQVQVQLGEVNHGFRGFSKASPALSGFNTSGACEINVACPAVSAWDPTAANSVARISIGGAFLCSGSLVNNVRQDKTPYFLTAHHCEIPTYGAASVVFYWSYQFATCANSTTEPTYQTQTGSTQVADDLTGWDASGTDVPSSGAVIHHPLGDVKKTSLYNTAPTRQSNAPLTGNNGTVNLTGAWIVFYSQGSTEEGSSGSPLFNQSQQVIGQLSGGTADCNNASSTDTRNNGESDIYARTDVAWTANTTASGQLKAWLDPDNTGTLTLNGKAASSASVAISVNPTTITLGNSAALTWSSTNATSCTASDAWSGTQATSASNFTVTPTTTGPSTYTLTCTGPGGNASGSAVLTVNSPSPGVTISVNPTTVTLGNPATLSWSSTNATSCNASGAWSGTQATSGTLSETPAATGVSTYTLSCTGPGGTTANSATLAVNNTSSGSSGGGGGGSLPPLTLGGLLALRLLRRRAISRRASCA